MLPYRSVRHGDIMVFLSPAEPGLYVVKRIMGIPGDRIHLRDGAVYRNGEKLEEPYVIHSTGADAYNPYRDNFPAVPPSEFNNVAPNWQLTLKDHIQGDDIVVPPDSYFGMGDNRDVSYDSRYWGFIPRANVIGRPMFIYWSFETPPNQYLEREVSQRVGFLAHVVFHFFDETRWRRTLKAVQ
jgi:signal peptidase I